MDLNERWNAIDWQESEFSFAKEDLRAELRRQSKHDLTRLLAAYKRLYYFSVALTPLTPLLMLLKPEEPEYVFSIGLISLYWVVVSGFLALKFSRFKRPDFSLQPTEAIQTTLALVRSINSFQLRFTSFLSPLVFLGSLLGTLTYGGRTFSEIGKSPVVLAVVVVSTLLVIWYSRYAKRYLANRQCTALIAKLEGHLRSLREDE
ncbi:MAG: hypothetical protein H7Y12_11260 [Sphingobacteriaceae bacterium]|nr:hypothetical protein [Cytophagaceae bacterium]